MTLFESLLNGVQMTIAGQTFDGGDLAAVNLCNQEGARFEDFSVNFDRTGATLSGVATHVSSGKTLMFTKQLYEESFIGQLMAYLLPIDLQC